MLNNGSKMLDKILEVGKMSTHMKGIWFEPRSMNNKDKIMPKKFVPHNRKTGVLNLDRISQHRAKHVSPSHRKNKNQPQICHHYGKYGHIRPYCFRLYGYPLHSMYLQLLVDLHLQ